MAVERVRRFAAERRRNRVEYALEIVRRPQNTALARIHMAEIDDRREDRGRDPAQAQHFIERAELVLLAHRFQPHPHVRTLVCEEDAGLFHRVGGVGHRRLS